MCNLRRCCGCCCYEGCCIDCGYAWEECQQSCARNCFDCISSCGADACRLDCAGCDGAQCGSCVADACRRSLGVFECIGKIPSFLGGVFAIFMLVYLYSIWAIVALRAQQASDSVEQISSTLTEAQEAVNKTLRGYAP